MKKLLLLSLTIVCISIISGNLMVAQDIGIKRTGPTEKNDFETFLFVQRIIDSLNLVNSPAQQKITVIPGVTIGGPVAPDALPILENVNVEQDTLAGSRHDSNALKPNGPEMKLNAQEITALPEIQEVPQSGEQPMLQSSQASEPDNVGAAGINLTPYQNTGWDDKLVVSNVTGTHTSTLPLFNTQTLYVDWAVVNNGDAAISGTTFYYYLYVDGVAKANWFASSMPCCGYFHYVNDVNIGVLAAGSHTITIRADVTNTVAENNETDNAYTRTITVSPYLNLAPYQPAGWDSPLVLSKVTGTTTSVTTFLNTDNIYVDWSVANYGGYATAHDFYVCLYIDGVHTAHWYQGLGAGSFKSQLDYLVGKLSAGTHTIGIRIDIDGFVPESNETDNVLTRTITVLAPNLTPYQPSGWDNKIPVTTSSTAHTSSAPFFNTQTLYVNLSVINNGTAVTQSGITFWTRLYVDGVLKDSWSNSNFSAGAYFWLINNYNIGILTAGTHTITVTTDQTGTIAESNETDNTYTRTITVYPSVNLTPYQPSGWDNKLVLSTVTGTHTSAATINDCDNIYLDWSVVNYGPYATNHNFYVDIIVDGALKATWYTTIGANTWITFSDHSLGKLPAGTHTIKIRIDLPENYITEFNETDNEYTRTITIGTCGNTLGNTTIYSSSSTTANRRALPITFTQAGAIQSISIFHNGGTGNVLLGVYENSGTSPAARLGVTASTPINPAAGWQTVALTSPINVTSGQTVWLAWVFQTNPGIRYITGTPARAESSATWAGGMPTTFGSASYANYKYSIYCTYTEPSAFLTVSPTTVTLGSAAGSSGTFSISSNVTWNISDDGSWLTVSPISGSNGVTITVTASSANPGPSTRSATVTVTGTGGVTPKTVIVTQEAPPPPDGINLGNTTVYASSSTTANRRALPVTFTEAGTIQSISIYHNGGTGNVLLGVYENSGTSPAARLGVTASTPINSAAGWQKVNLTSPVTVSSGQTVWLSWVFQTNPGIRYIVGTPARAESSATWAGGMPTTFGTATYANYKYSIYCTYTTGGPKTLGNTTVYSSSSTTANRRALPITFTEAGTIQNISMYHNGGTGNVLLGVYSNVSGAPTTILSVTPSTPISSSAGWQTIALTNPVAVTSGQTVWLSWVFQTNPGIRYIVGTPARAESPALWAGGMPATFGTATYGNYKYSIYCSYNSGAGVAKSSDDGLAVNPDISDKEMMALEPNQTDISKEKVLIYPNPTSGSVTVRWNNYYDSRLLLTIYSMQGTPVKTVQIEPEINEVKVELQNIEYGLYILELKDTKNGLVISRSRLIKQ